jgi:hypothetical protein
MRTRNEKPASGKHENCQANPRKPQHQNLIRARQWPKESSSPRPNDVRNAAYIEVAELKTMLALQNHGGHSQHA